MPSPTFTLVEIYGAAPPLVWHFDLFRLERAEEVWELGIEDAFADGISLIEWPERLGELLPRERLDIELAFGAARRRAHRDPRAVLRLGSRAWGNSVSERADAIAAFLRARRVGRCDEGAARRRCVVPPLCPARARPGARRC